MPPVTIAALVPGVFYQVTYTGGGKTLTAVVQHQLTLGGTEVDCLIRSGKATIAQGRITSIATTLQSTLDNPVAS